VFPDTTLISSLLKPESPMPEHSSVGALGAVFLGMSPLHPRGAADTLRHLDIPGSASGKAPLAGWLGWT